MLVYCRSLTCIGDIRRLVFRNYRGSGSEFKRDPSGQRGQHEGTGEKRLDFVTGALVTEKRLESVQADLRLYSRGRPLTGHLYKPSYRE